MLGWYKPFMIAGGAIFTVGAGLLYTLQVNSGTGKWIGYQLVCGFGAGAGVQSNPPSPALSPTNSQTNKTQYPL